MNMKFWKKKKAPEESDNHATDKTIAATESGSTPAQPGFLARLKSTLSPSRKKGVPDEAAEPPSSRHKDGKHGDKEPDATPPKSGFLERLKSALMPSRKMDKTEKAEKPEERKPSAERTDKKHPGEEPEPEAIPAKNPKKRLAIALALLIPLAAGGGYFAVTKLLPPHQETPPPKNTTSLEIKTDGHPAPEQAKAAEQVPQPEPAQPLTEPVPKQIDAAARPINEVPEPAEGTPVADAPTDMNIQTQIDALKKQNQEIQAQIEVLMKQPVAGRSTKSSSATVPREGVLIINGKNTKDSVLGLKKVIDDMNGPSGAKDVGK